MTKFLEVHCNSDDERIDFNQEGGRFVTVGQVTETNRQSGKITLVSLDAAEPITIDYNRGTLRYNDEQIGSVVQTFPEDPFE